MNENWFALRSWYRSARVKHLPCRRSQHRRARGRLRRGHPRRRPRGRHRGARRVQGGRPARSAAALGLPARGRRAAARGGRRDRRGRRGRDRPAGGAPARRARAHRGPARGLRRGRRRRRLRRGDHRHARPRRQADPAARRATHARAHRAGGGLRRQQLPARLLDRGRRHRQRARGRLPGRSSRATLRIRARARWSRASSPPPSAEAGLPGATFALLQSSGFEVGEALVDEPAIAAVGFTGSFAGGKALHDRAAARERPIPVFAEMGSVNPIVVTEAALAERGEAIAEGLAASVASFGGQLCTKPGVVFVPAGEAGDAFAADLGARLAAAEPQVLLNERLRDALTERVARAPRPGRARRRCRDGRRAGLPLPPGGLPRGGGRRPRPSRRCSRSASARSCCC